MLPHYSLWQQHSMLIMAESCLPSHVIPAYSIFSTLVNYECYDDAVKSAYCDAA